MARSALDIRLPSPLVEITDERLGSVRVLLKRDDLIAAHVGGNKWRKLRYLVDEVVGSGVPTLLTFGGAYSNHVRALAAIGTRLGMRTIGVIRGEELPFNALLAACVEDGMQVVYLDRATYRRKTDEDVIAALRRAHGDFYLVPEGGTTVHAVRGCGEVVAEIDTPFDLIMTAVGTGGTLAGLAAGLGPHQRALGISSLRGARSLDLDVDDLHEAALGHTLRNWSIDHRFHHGGFARRSAALDEFIDEFERRHGFRPDHVYVGKMLYALFAMVASGEIAAESVVVALVTGAPSG